MSQNELLFLEASEIQSLAGKKNKKTQVEALRKMGIYFFINANGAPVVPRPQFFGQKIEIAPQWKPRVLQGR